MKIQSCLFVPNTATKPIVDLYIDLVVPPGPLGSPHSPRMPVSTRTFFGGNFVANPYKLALSNVYWMGVDSKHLGKKKRINFTIFHIISPTN